ncbi:MAG: hypothetical protein WCV50_04580 [Patescibacteria group bacterium]|jgi:hypothetical protein
MKIKYLLILVAVVIVSAALYVFVILPNNEDGATDDSQANGNSNSSLSMTTYQNDEYRFTLSYPSGWRHNSVDTSDAASGPYFPFVSMALEEFGSDDVKQSKIPFTENDQRIHFGIEVYEIPEEYSSEGLKSELGYTNTNTRANIYKGMFGNYRALVMVIDDTNHEIESARMFSQSYLIQKNSLWYKVSVTARRESVINENSTLIKQIENSFRILE